MDHLDYQQSKDVLIHVGDILTRGSHKGSLAIVDYMASHNVTGVRGNHDQKVIEWRAWIDWASQQKGGAAWLASLEKRYYKSHPYQSTNDKEIEDNEDPELWLETCKTAEDEKWLPQIPKGWIMLSEHYKLARDMSVEGYKYLLGLPLRIYIPSAHTFIVHAGLLPYNPVYNMDDKDKQPLARIPPFPKRPAKHSHHSIEDLRNMQEIGILTEIPQNKKPWVVLNMRSVKGDKISRKAKAGKSWSSIWNKQMQTCVGYGRSLEDRSSATVFSNSEDNEHVGNGEWEGEEGELTGNTTVQKKINLPCYPSTTIYGHAAGRGLDIKRWTIGLDSGCVSTRLPIGMLQLISFIFKVYNERLSALVLGPKKEDEQVPYDDMSNAKHPDRSISYGDEGEAKIVSVQC